VKLKKRRSKMEEISFLYKIGRTAKRCYEKVTDELAGLAIGYMIINTLSDNDIEEREKESALEMLFRGILSPFEDIKD
jgi:hypothetical protein